MRLWVIVVLAVVTWFVVAMKAQSPHPCDMVSATSYRVRTSDLPILKVRFCFTPATIDGMVLIEPVGFTLQAGNLPEVDLGMLTPIGGPNSQGEFYYEVQTPLAVGTISVRAYTAQLGQSDPATIKLSTYGRKR